MRLAALGVTFISFSGRTSEYGSFKSQELVRAPEGGRSGLRDRRSGVEDPVAVPLCEKAVPAGIRPAL